LQVASLSEQFNANPSEDEINSPFWVIFSRKEGRSVLGADLEIDRDVG
jgi:hypothetical protein